MTLGPTPPVDKAVLLLRMLDEQTREQVLGRMGEQARSVVEERIVEQASTPSDHLGGSIADRRRLMRETLLSMHQRARAEAAGVTNALDDQAGLGQGDGPHPLDQLAEVHPAAVARALQGEQAEAWAIVIDRLAEPARQTLLAWLAPASREAIEAARGSLQGLPPQLRATTERAIQQAVLPRALREHELLMTTPMPPMAAAGGRSS